MPHSYVLVKEGGKSYVGLIKEGSIGLWWYKGPRGEGEMVINKDNVFDLIEMKEVGTNPDEIDLRSNYYNEVGGVVCRVGFSGLRTCVNTDSLTDGMYLCRAGSKEWKKVDSFTIDFWKKRNRKLLCNIKEDNVFRAIIPDSSENKIHRR